MSNVAKRLPSLNALRAFEVASRHLNFRIAAEEIGVTQGAVAQQIRGLEEELGLMLFERQSRGLAITTAGRAYAASITHAFDLITEATRALKPQPEHLTISVTPRFASKWLIPRLPAFRLAYPNIDLRIVATERVSSFQTDAIDLAIRLGQPPFGAGLNSALLFEQRIIAVGNPRLLAQVGRPNGTNIDKFHLLHDAHNLWPQFLASEFPNATPIPTKHIRFNQTSHAIEAAIAGHGVALANRHFVKDDIALGHLEKIFNTEFKADADFYIVYLRKSLRQKRTESVVQWLLGQVSASTE